MKRKGNTVLALSLLAVMLACQPTPEKEIVVNKADGKMEQMIFSDNSQENESVEATPENSPDAAQQAQEADPPVFPEHWTEDLSTQHMNLTIDAEIDFGGMTSFPVYEISNADLSNDKKLLIIQALLPEAEAAYEGSSRTKEEIAEKLENAMRGAEKRTENGEVEYVPWERQEEYITELKRQYQSAVSDTEKYRPVQPSDLLQTNATYAIREKNGQKGWMISGKQSKGDIGFEVCNAGLEVYVQRESWGVCEVWDEEETPVVMHPNISEETAKDTGERFFHQIGMESPTLVYVEPARIYSSVKCGVISEGYYLRFRQNAGYPVIYYPIYTTVGGCLSIDASEAYSSPWSMETIELYVDESGIRWINWINPVEIGECVNRNVQLLPFEEIQRIIRNLLRAGMRNVEDTSMTGYRMTNMYLTAYPIALSDQKGYVLAPVWYLSFEVYGLNPFSNVIRVDYLEQWERMAILINAIDGSTVLVPNGHID